MPTPVAHSLAGAAVALVSTKEKSPDVRLLAGSIAAACAADLDFGISFVLGRNVHHYFTHSLGFTLLFAGAVYALARWTGSPRPRKLSLVLGLSYLTHLLLDMLSKDTSAPYGVELFWPLSDRFVISPVLLFDDIWRGTLAKLLGPHNWLAVAREFALVGPLVALVVWWKGKSRGRRQLE
jgi:membrane-bound metal-dependent hydrolase YbcI (DUF457 family)